jgi:dTDP-4-amino-4,6-dideoxygalactose transaminase
MTLSHIPFNKPYMTGKEHLYIQQAYNNTKLAGDGPFTQFCNYWIEQRTGCTKSLLTHSCTAALEMSAILADIQPGDEVIMPSYTFASTANAFVLRGGVPIFVDIRTDTLNIDESLIEAAITKRTKAIVAVHYSGIACEMDAIMDIANRYKLLVIEDAAQGFLANYKGKALGSIGHLGCFSFHETKNIISGEGGALLINSPILVDRAEVIREKGTNRSRFFRGQVDKYTWIDIGSSYLPGEITAAFLWAQLQKADDITVRRINIWNRYHEAFELLEKSRRLRRPIVPIDCAHNAHMYYLLLRDLAERTEFIEAMRQQDINCVFHYIPLHSSPAGQRYGRAHGGLDTTNLQSERLVRLPMFFELSESKQERVVETVRKCLA